MRRPRAIETTDDAVLASTVGTVFFGDTAVDSALDSAVVRPYRSVRERQRTT